jgi:hypothetical protein
LVRRPRKLVERPEQRLLRRSAVQAQPVQLLRLADMLNLVVVLVVDVLPCLLYLPEGLQSGAVVVEALAVVTLLLRLFSLLPVVTLVLKPFQVQVVVVRQVLLELHLLRERRVHLQALAHQAQF